MNSKQKYALSREGLGETGKRRRLSIHILANIRAKCAKNTRLTTFIQKFQCH